MGNTNINKSIGELFMNKEMILAILVAYKAFNDKSLTVVTDEYVVNFAVIDSIDNDTVSLLSYANDDNYSRITINIDDITGIQFQSNMSVDTIDYEDIYDNVDDYEYPYNHINRSDLV